MLSSRAMSGCAASCSVSSVASSQGESGCAKFSRVRRVVLCLVELSLVQSRCVPSVVSSQSCQVEPSHIKFGRVESGQFCRVGSSYVRPSRVRSVVLC